MSSEKLSSKDAVKFAPFPNQSDNNILVDTLSSTPLLRYLTFPYTSTGSGRETAIVPGKQNGSIAPHPIKNHPIPATLHPIAKRLSI